MFFYISWNFRHKKGYKLKVRLIYVNEIRDLNIDRIYCGRILRIFLHFRQIIVCTRAAVVDFHTPNHKQERCSQTSCRETVSSGSAGNENRELKIYENETNIINKDGCLSAMFT